MPRVCTVCAHPERRKIDQALLAGTEPERAIASRWHVSRASLQRHRDGGHVSQRIAKSAAGRELLESESIAQHISELRRNVSLLHADACELLESAKRDKDSRIALRAIDAARSCIAESRELTRVLAELAGRLPTPGISLAVLAPALVGAFDSISDPSARAAAKNAVAARLQALDRTLELPPAGNTLPARPL